MAAAEIAILSPDAIFLQGRALSITKVPYTVLRKIHGSILHYFDEKNFKISHVLYPHLDRLRSLNDMYSTDPTNEDIAVFRAHIAQFVTAWHTHVPPSATVLDNFKSVQAALTKLSTSTTGQISATIKQSQTEETGSVKISSSGGLKLVPKAVPNISLTELKAQIDDLKTRLVACTDTPSDATCTTRTLQTGILETEFAKVETSVKEVNDMNK